MEKFTKLIGIYSPLPQSGKTTISTFLCEEGGFVRIPFAEPMKDVCMFFLEGLGLSKFEAYSLTHTYKEDQIPGLPDGVTGRYFMQRLGTDFARNLIDPDIWVKAWKVSLEKERGKSKLIVVDDVRFENEAQAVKDAGGELWKVVRPSLTANGTEKHASEQGLEHLVFDKYIVNDGSVEDLWNKLSLTTYAREN